MVWEKLDFSLFLPELSYIFDDFVFYLKESATQVHWNFENRLDFDNNQLKLAYYLHTIFTNSDYKSALHFWFSALLSGGRTQKFIIASRTLYIGT